MKTFKSHGSVSSKKLPNPFEAKLVMTKFRIFQTVIMSLTIAPIRLFFFLLFTLLTYLLASLLSIGTRFDPDEPMSKFRYSLVVQLKHLIRACLFCCGFHRILVRGRQSPEARVLPTAPHTVKYFDSFVQVAVDREFPSFVSLTKYKSQPVLGALLKVSQSVLVDHGSSKSRGGILARVESRVKGRKWPQLVVYPEGHMTDGTALIKFKKGAFAHASPVQPVTIEYLNEWDTFRWSNLRPRNFKWACWLALCQWQTTCRVTFMPVYRPSEAEKADWEVLAGNVQKMMAESLNVPISECTAEDGWLMKKQINSSKISNLN